MPPPSPEQIDRLSRVCEAGGLRFAFHDAPRRLGDDSHDVWAFNDRVEHGPVHGDAHPANLWWHEGELTLLDWEWVRSGPPDLELQHLVDRADTAAVDGERGRPELLEGLGRHYPELFAHPRLLDRLRLYSLLWAVRHAAVLRPRGPWSGLPAAHSGNRLWRLVEGRWPAPGALPPI